MADRKKTEKRWAIFYAGKLTGWNHANSEAAALEKACRLNPNHEASKFAAEKA